MTIPHLSWQKAETKRKLVSMRIFQKIVTHSYHEVFGSHEKECTRSPAKELEDFKKNIKLYKYVYNIISL